MTHKGWRVVKPKLNQSMTFNTESRLPTLKVKVIIELFSCPAHNFVLRERILM